MLAVALTCVLVSLILWHWINLINDRNKQSFRGPFPLPVLGNAHKLLVPATKFLETLSHLAKQYNDGALLYLLSDRYIILSHPKYVDTIVSSMDLITKGRSYDFLLPWLGTGLLTSTGQKWRKHRKFLTPAFHFNILQTYLPVFLKNDKILIDKLRKLADGTPVDIFPILALTALDNVAESVMGVSVNAQKEEESKYVKAIDDISRIISVRIRNVFMGLEFIFNWTSEKVTQDNALSVLFQQSESVIEARYQQLKQNNITKLEEQLESGVKNKHAFLDLLLLGEIDGEKIDMKHIREEVDTFLFEGHDTTTSGLTFTLYCLSKYLDVQKKVLEEQYEIFGDDPEREPTYNDLQRMKYLDCVIKESLRLYPSVPLIERFVTEDTEIGDGLKIEKNTSVLLNIYEIQRHPDVYEDPLEFKPERFEVTNKKASAYSWLAFSAGPRNCIGQKFAMMELKLVVSSVVKHFEVLWADLPEPEVTGDLILKAPAGVHIRLLPRTTAI